jgi:hypothetical protein
MTETRKFSFNIPERFQPAFMDKLAEMLKWYGDHYNSIDNKGQNTVTLTAERPVDPWFGPQE